MIYDRIQSGMYGYQEYSPSGINYILRWNSKYKVSTSG